MFLVANGKFYQVLTMIPDWKGFNCASAHSCPDPVDNAEFLSLTIFTDEILICQWHVQSNSFETSLSWDEDKII